MAAIIGVVFIVCLILGWREKRTENWTNEGTSGEEASLTVNSNTNTAEGKQIQLFFSPPHRAGHVHSITSHIDHDLYDHIA